LTAQPSMNFCVETGRSRTVWASRPRSTLQQRFDRKNYFLRRSTGRLFRFRSWYHPIVGEGEVLVESGAGVGQVKESYGAPGACGTQFPPWETDAGKSIHDMARTCPLWTGTVPVSRWDGISSASPTSRPERLLPIWTKARVRSWRYLVRAMATCSRARMRADVDVSDPAAWPIRKNIRRAQDFSHLGTRCEIRNNDSMRFIQQRRSTSKQKPPIASSKPAAKWWAGNPFCSIPNSRKPVPCR